MSTTFDQLKTDLSQKLRDPDFITFSESTVGEFVNAGLVEVSRILPVQFQEDITPVADTLDYTLRSAEFSAEAQPEIEVARVELWDGDNTPPTQVRRIEAASESPIASTENGWSVWGGILHIPHYIFSIVDGFETRYYYRVWGYSPHPALVADADVAAISAEARAALLAYARMDALDTLLADRDLFSQWQARTGNTDMSPAGLMNQWSSARDDWRRRSGRLLRLRAAV